VRGGVGRAEEAEAQGDARRLVRVRGDEGGGEPRREDDAGRLVHEGGGRRAHGPDGGVEGGRAGVGPGRLDGQDLEDLADAHARAGEDLHGLGRGGQRLGQEGGVAVEGDELARGDVPREGQAGAVPDHAHQQQPGQERLQRVQDRLRARHLDARAPHLLRLLPVAGREGLLAADPAQDPQARDGVGPEGRQPAARLTLGRLPLLERPDHQGQHAGHRRETDQDGHAQGRRGPQQQDGHHDVADHGAHQA